ncbi:MAG TPA: sodium:solute symporter, partial [Burkholderiales bacterium]
MLPGWIVVAASFAYLGVLFAIAYFGDKRADQGRSIIANPYIYSLSLAVYCTSWTFYGSVGRAAGSGIGFLPIYLGPTLMAALWWILLLKIIRISKVNRITSIADFIASRYGKSQSLGGLVTVIAVVGIIPYISLQLKAVSNTFAILLQYPHIVMPAAIGEVPILHDSAFYIAMLLAAFTILFGTRHLDATERHEGMVAAIAFESLVKLVAFLAVGAFVTFGMYEGFGDIFDRAAGVPKLDALLTLGGAAGTFGTWFSLTFVSMLSIMLLPRQFQISVVENVNENHITKATWLFPMYLLAINVFVLPIAFGGLMHFPDGSVDADTFVLTLPMAEGRPGLALLVFIGGLSAATGMVIVETIALSTMVCNDLVMPLLLRSKSLQLTRQPDLSGLLLAIRRWAIALILLLGYFYFRIAGEAYALVSIGLISFAAVAQFAPAIIGGLFWREGNRAGAFAGLCGGFAVWAYTLLLPSFARSGWLPMSFIEQGPLGVALLKPLQLFGLSGLDQIS